MQKLITLLKKTGCLTNLIIKPWQWLLTLYRPWQIKVYLKNHPIRKMQIGTGTGLNAMAGWLNTDLIPRTTKLVFLDARKRFPLGDCTLDYIFSESMIYAIEYSAAVNMLRECFRTLKPGGKIRIATVDLAFFINLYINKEKTELQKQFIRYSMKAHVRMPDIHQHEEVFIMNLFFRAWNSKFNYDYEVLRDTVAQVGFINVTRHQRRESNDKNLQGLEAHGINYEAIQSPSELGIGLIVEAQKPE
jgi:predicted SAM-dependent methyltransferase